MYTFRVMDRDRGVVMLGGGHYNLKWPGRSGWMLGYVALIAAKELLPILVGGESVGEVVLSCVIGSGNQRWLLQRFNDGTLVEIPFSILSLSSDFKITAEHVAGVEIGVEDAIFTQ